MYENTFRIKPGLTKKELGFINDVDLRNDLFARLKELERVDDVEAYYSIVFLSLSIIEGIFRHIAKIYKKEIQSSSQYPINEKEQKPKEFDKLYIEELYVLLRELKIIPPEPDFQQSFELFRKYRNFIHPQAWVKKRWEVGLGQAQMAIGLLNSTIQNFEKNVFIDKHILEIIAGNPSYDSDGLLHLPMNGTRHRSFVVVRQILMNKLEIDFNLSLSHDSILNFVFNYNNDGDFKMIRLDSRSDESFYNCVLESSQRYRWKIILRATPESPPERDLFPVRINIDIPNGVFDFIVDDLTYSFQDQKTGKTKPLYTLIRPNFRIGFFNEVGRARCENITIKIN